MLLVLLVLTFSASACAQSADAPALRFALSRPAQAELLRAVPPPPPTEFEHFNLAPARSRRGVARLTWSLDSPSPLPALELGKRPVLSPDRQLIRSEHDAPKPSLKSRLKRLVTAPFR